MKKAILVLGIAGAIVGWHVCVATSMENESYTINPLTDVATLKLPGAASYGITDPQEAAGFIGGRDLVGIPNAERKLNLYARQYFDVYVMLIPYRVVIVDEPSGHSGGTASSPIQPPTHQSEKIKPEMLPEMEKAKQRLFGNKAAEVDTYTVSGGGGLQDMVAVMDGCKPHFCNDHNAMWTVDFSTGQAGKAAGEITSETEVVVNLGDYGSQDELPSELQAEIKRQSSEAFPSPKLVRYVHESTQ